MTSRDSPSLPGRPDPAFATTRWSIVVSAGRQSSANSKQALAALCETYWFPLYSYVRRRVVDVAEAQDLTQAFFAELLQKNYVGTATPERGRFRAFLITAFKHFLSKEWDKAKAQKRGGGRAPIALDFSQADSHMTIEPASGLTPEQHYDRQWAMTLLHQILSRLQCEFDESGRGEHFLQLRPFLIGEQAGITYATVAARLGMTEAAAKMAASRMRKRYREMLRQEIGQTVATPEDVDDEIRKLFATLQL